MTYFKRKLSSFLYSWKDSPDRKPLIIRGARQVGKTTLVRHFGASYTHFISLNLEKKEHRSIFERIDRIKSIVDAIFLQTNTKRDGKSTLLFIDEIQQSPEAIRQLRFFYEEYPDIHVIAAGSLLEFALSELTTFPVGRVEQVVLHPMDFEEFLLARGHDAAIEALNSIPIAPFAFESLLAIFHEYAIIGGMPEVVSRYLQEGTMANLPAIYDNLWVSYRDDISKYATSPAERNLLRYVIEIAVSQNDRITFARVANQQFSASAIGRAFRLWEQTRLIQLIYPTTALQMPATPALSRKPRLQFLDTGLLNARLGVQAEMIGVDDLFIVSSGRIIQHLVYQEVIAQQTSPLYVPAFWVREKANSNAEVDLVIPSGGSLVPVEIKSGAQGRLRSLHQFIDRSEQPFAIRMLANQLSVEQAHTPSGTPYTLLNLPYFLGAKIREYIEWFDKHG